MGLYCQQRYFWKVERKQWLEWSTFLNQHFLPVPIQSTVFFSNTISFICFSKISDWRLEKSWRQLWWLSVGRRYTNDIVLGHALSVCARRSIAKTHLALQHQPSAGQPCFISEAPRSLLWNNVPSSKEEVALVLLPLVELLRCFSGSKTANGKSQSKLDCVEDPTCFFQQTSVLKVNTP